MSASARPVWLEPATRTGTTFKAIALVTVVLIVLYPLVGVVTTSLASQDEITRSGGFVLLPSDPSLAAYRTVLGAGAVTRAVLVSAVLTVVGTAVSLAVTVSLAYGLSRPGIIGAQKVLLLVIFTLFFTAGIIPNFLVVKSFGLLNSYAALVVPVLMNAFNLLVIRSFFQQLPRELFDSAKVDGASEVGTLVRIVLPLSRAVLAVVGLFYAVGYWNAFFNALIYLNDSSKWPLSVVVRLYVLQGQPIAGSTTVGDATAQAPVEAVQMAIIVLALLPLLAVYPFVQRFFVKGVLTGAVKG